MGTPDGHIENPEGTILLDLKTIEVKGGMRPMPTVREWNPRFPRKLKKKLKKYHGDNYHNWLNSPIRYVVNFDESNIYYHEDAEKELTELLLKELGHENNENC